jgi:predicted nucleic acid-binding protein
MILVDTWAWVGLADRRDQYHRQAKAQNKKLRRTARRYVTTDHILGETITYLYSAIGAAQAQNFVSAILANVDSGQYSLVHLSPAQFRRAWDLRRKYHDKPNISFVDLTSMVVMQDLGITDVFTGDDHFRQVNLGFSLVP